ncbi:transporter substrate-binding domain-containing protein [Terasakiella sp. SH-1]|uniref:substrate-binding periplasmic protein n=1 Tax=Terasakiella sp. SH-1 TaxID=2560057 RepID=UPI00142F4F99|nr:transporter substrate-binding domain-containing protein [Terasakiella sp. SH-1]
MARFWLFWAFLFCWLIQPLEAKTYRVALANIPPYAFYDSNGSPQGILVDIAREAFGGQGHEVSFQFFPWPRAIQNVKVGRVDAITPFFRNAQREEYVYFLGKGGVTMDLQFFKEQTKAFQVSNLDEAAGLRIVKVSKASLGPDFAAWEKAGLLKIDYVPNTQAGLKVLLAGRCDLLASVSAIAKFSAQNAGVATNIVPAGVPFAQMTAFLAFSKASMSEQEARTIASELDKMHKNGRVKELVTKYTP